MKRVFVSILLMLFISGCSKGGAAQSDSSDINSTADDTSTFSQALAELKPMSAEQSSYSNSVNLKGGVSGKMCYVEKTDTLFYSDKNGTFLKNGEKSVKLLDKQTSALNAADGKLYFIIPEGENTFGEFGKAYRMELSDGKTECIIDEDVINISVYKDRIFFKKVTDINIADNGLTSYAVQFFKCGLDGGERAQIFDFAFAFDGDMCVTRDGDTINILDMSNGKSEKMIDEPNGVKNLSLYGGSLHYIRTDYSTQTDVLIRVNLADKSVGELSAAGYIEDYGFVGGKLCVYDLVDFYLEENGKLIKYADTKNTYRAVYTCKDKVYGICGESLYEIAFVEDHGMRSISETRIGGAENEA